MIFRVLFAIACIFLASVSFAHEVSSRCVIKKAYYPEGEGFEITSSYTLNGDRMQCGTGDFVVNGETRTLTICGRDINFLGYKVSFGEEEESEAFSSRRDAIEEALYLRDEGKCIFPTELAD